MSRKADQKITGGASMFACSEMKRSPSELALEELFKHTRPTEDDFPVDQKLRSQGMLGDNNGDDAFGLQNRSFPRANPGMGSSHSGYDANADNAVWSRTLPSRHSSHSATIDSQSSICIGSPTYATNPKIRENNATAATSGSSGEQSEDDDAETEAGPSEQSHDSIDLKRIKRMVSNRESARRSRRRKQAHLADLEHQAEQLRGENASLVKQLADASQQCKDATTNYRVLKSDVEALRAKVKLAEDMVARGSLTSNLSNLLQNYLNTNPQSYYNNNTVQVENISQTVAVRGDDQRYPTGISSANRLENNIDNFQWQTSQDWSLK